LQELDFISLIVIKHTIVIGFFYRDKSIYND